MRQGPEHPHGVPAADYLRFRDQLARDLREVKDPATGTPLVAQVHTRDEVFAGPLKEMAPDLTLELRDGGLISILASDVHFRQPPGGERYPPAGGQSSSPRPGAESRRAPARALHPGRVAP